MEKKDTNHDWLFYFAIACLIFALVMKVLAFTELGRL